MLTTSVLVPKSCARAALALVAALPVFSQNLVHSALSFAKNASAGIALSGRTFVTVMQAAEVRNRDDRSDSRDRANMRTLLVES